MNLKFFYDRYHGDRKLQRRIVSKSHFTYRSILSVIERFGVGTRYLDVGCGVGTTDFYLAKKGISVDGIDISPNAINVAKENAKLFKLEKRLCFEVMDFPKEYPKVKYDFIICSEVLEHLKDDKKAVEKIYQLLKSKGRIFVTAPSKGSLYYRFSLIKNYDRRVGHFRRYTFASMQKLLEGAGFEIIYAQDYEAVIRESLYMFKILNIPLRLANKFELVGNLVTFVDNLLTKVFGGAHVYMVARKK